MEDNSQNRGVPYVPENRRTQRHIYDRGQIDVLGFFAAVIALMVFALLGALVVGVFHTVP